MFPETVSLAHQPRCGKLTDCGKLMPLSCNIQAETGQQPVHTRFAHVSAAAGIAGVIPNIRQASLNSTLLPFQQRLNGTASTLRGVIRSGRTALNSLQRQGVQVGSSQPVSTANCKANGIMQGAVLLLAHIEAAQPVLLLCVSVIGSISSRSGAVLLDG